VQSRTPNSRRGIDAYFNYARDLLETSTYADLKNIIRRLVALSLRLRAA
jgi:hypothetical protein